MGYRRGRISSARWRWGGLAVCIYLAASIADAQSQNAAPRCTGRWPNAANLLGGARILLALQNVDVPWYIQQQVDIHPDSNWRQPQRDPNWYDPLAAPVISMENTHGAAVVDPSVVQWKNLTLDRLDFTQYVQIEPEDNDALIKQHVNDVLVEFPSPPMESIKPLEMTLFLSYRGSKTR